MAGQAILGEAILQTIDASQATVTPETMETLVARHSLMAFRIAYSILRNHHDAEDAVQECFLRALKYGKDLRRVRNPKTWLARIAWTAALDRRSARAGVLQMEDAEGPELLEQFRGHQRGLDEQVASREMGQFLEKMIATLPEDIRHPLVLSTVQELNAGEIAELLGIPESSVRTRLMRARKLLKEKLSVLLEAKHG